MSTCRTWFLDESALLQVWLVHFRRFRRWRQRTGSSFPERSLMCPTLKLDWATVKQSESSEISRRTHQENYFRFAAAILETGQNRLGQPPRHVICRDISSGTRGTASEHHFWSAAATLKNDRSRLGHCQTVNIRRETTSATDTRRTKASGEVGPVVFDHLLT